MQIADRLRPVQLANPDRKFIATGHCLGGGLASAAYAVTGWHTYTFNSAGLNIKTLYDRDAQGNFILDAQGNPVEKYLGSIARFNNAAPFVQARYVDFDILSLVQDAVPFVPDALGTRIEMDGPYDFETWGSRAILLAAIASPFDGPLLDYLASLAGAYYMGKSQLNDAVLYGLLVDYWAGKDLLGYDL